MTEASVPLDFVPSTPEDLARCLVDPMWRVCSGQLYKIMVKGAKEGESSVIPFVPNRAQRRLLGRLWYRNIILKARQLGFTTLIAILWLDHALFVPDQRCGIIAQDREAAEVIFRDKVKLAYDRLPDELRERMPLARDSASELLFAHNNSSIRVATSMRSGTIHRLHVSEFGKICAQFRDKAREVVTGSLPAVPVDGIAVIESTAEGQDGDFYTMTQRAMGLAEQRAELSPRDWRFHFFPWWQESGYTIPPAGVILTDKDRDYFAKVEAETGRDLAPGQRAWYVATRDADFSGDAEKMWQEYPSTPQEAFQVSTEGMYYAAQLAAARKAGRIGLVPYVEGVPVNTFWDIGNSDGTGIWLHQRVGLQNRFIKYIEGWGEPYSFYVRELQALGYVWGKHYLPHDAEHKRQLAETIAAPRDELAKLMPGARFEIVPRVERVIDGIQVTRAFFSQCWFDAEGCKAGLIHLANYRKTWNEKRGCWSDEPHKDIHSEGADSFRQAGQGYRAPAGRDEEDRRGGRRRDWKTA